MPRDEISTQRKTPDLSLAPDDADDEVVDLLEVVKPGRGSSRTAKNDEEDFSADLDAMLDDLSADAAVPAAGDKPAPFPDPTPVDHTVNPDESLELPAMDDVDSLLRSFGASPKKGKAEKEGEQDFAAVLPDMPDLDALPIAAPKKAPSSAGQAAAKAPTPEEDDALLASLLADPDALAATKKTSAPEKASAPAQAPAAVKTPAAAKAPTPEEDDALFASLLADPDAPAAAKKGERDDAAAGAPDDALFADLDRVLAVDAQDTQASGDGRDKAAMDTDGLDLMFADSAADVPSPLEDIAADGGLASTPPVAGGAEPAADAAVAGSSEPESLPEAPEDPAEHETSGQEKVDPVKAVTAATSPGSAAPAPQKPSLTPAAAPSPVVREEATASRFDEVDLNELDALLDNMLATAPVSGPGPAAAGGAHETAPAPPPQNSSLPESSANSSALLARVTEQESMLAEQEAVLAEQADKVRVLQQDVASLSAATGEHGESIAACGAEVQELVQRFSGACDQIQALEHGLEKLAKVAPDQQADDPRFAELADRMQGLEERMAEHDAPDQAGPEQEDDPRFAEFAGKIQRLEEELAEQNARYQSLQAQTAELISTMEKRAAETAAKVIREELAALTASLA